MTRLGFLGSPTVSARCLERLCDAGHEVALVVTEPDRRRSRGGELHPTPVKRVALERGLAVSDDLADLLDAGISLGVVVAFGRLIRPAVLDRIEMVNLHFSLLPRWRGAAPVERAILAGDATTGVCLMKVEAGLDTGPVYARVATPIGEEETAGELTERLGRLGADLLVERLATGLGEPVPQEGEATYAAKITVDDLRLEPARPAVELARVTRVGRAWTTWRGRRLLVGPSIARERPVATAPGAPGELRAEGIVTGDGLLLPATVQLEGRRAQPYDEWRRGQRPAPGERVGAGMSGDG